MLILVKGWKMASKATKKTTNYQLIYDILDDQAGFMLSHLKSGDVRRKRIEHNLKILFQRLGEEIPSKPLYCE